MFIQLPQARIVPPEGHTDANLVFVGEAPGADEDRLGRPFVGRAGGVLDLCLHAAGIARSEVYLTNLVKTRPKDNNISPYFDGKRLTKLGLQAQSELLSELSKTKAKLIVALGAPALFALTGKLGISRLRGSFYPLIGDDSKMVLACLHPAATFERGRTASYKGTSSFIKRYFIVSDFRKALRLVLAEGKRVTYPERKLVIEMTFQEALEWIEYFKRQKRLAYDIEVVNHEVSCISFASGGHLSVSFPFYKVFNEEQEAHLWLGIADILRDSNIVKVGQNHVMFDSYFLALRNGIISQGGQEDIMIAHSIMYPDFPKGLDFLTSIHTNEPYYKDEGKNWNNPIDWLTFRRYNAKDSAVTIEAATPIFQELDETGYRETYEFTLSIAEPLKYMMMRGIKVNFDALLETKKNVNKQIERKQEALNKSAGRELNPLSPKDCQTFFYIEKGLPPYTKKVRLDDGSYESRVTCDDTALARLARPLASRPAVPEAKLVQELRGLHKLLGTYLDINFDSDGRMRCSYNIRGTDTGRLSSSTTVFDTGTNMQNLPDAFKKFLVSDGIFIEFDKRQAEWVVVAFESGDANMMQVVKEGLDPHIHTGYLMTGMPKELIAIEAKFIGHSTDADFISEIRREKFTPEAHDIMASCWLPRTMSVRQCGKKSNHGLNYDEGYSKFALINEIEEREAKTIIERYHQIYPGVRQTYHRSIQEQLERNGRVLFNGMRDRLMPNGRKRRFLDAWGDNLFKSAYAHIPQSTVGDLLNRGIRETYYDNSIDGEVLAQVHDSMLCQFENPGLPDTGATWLRLAVFCHKIKEHLEPTLVAGGREYKIETDMKIGLNWGDMEEVRFGISIHETAENLKKAYSTITNG